MKAADRPDPAGLPTDEPLGQADGDNGAAVNGIDEAEAPNLDELEQILLAMPKLTRSIFIARRLQDMSIAEICRRTGLSHKQVMRQLAKAIVHLARAYQRRQQ